MLQSTSHGELDVPQAIRFTREVVAESHAGAPTADAIRSVLERYPGYSTRRAFIFENGSELQLTKEVMSQSPDGTPMDEAIKILLAQYPGCRIIEAVVFPDGSELQLEGQGPENSLPKKGFIAIPR